MKRVDRTKALWHRDRAQSFLESMRFLQTDMVLCGCAVALLAVHAAISLADAVLIAYTGMRSNERNHRSVLEPLRTLCGARQVDREGTAHLDWLVTRKTDFAYGDKRLDPEKDILAATLKAERFVAWAYRCFPGIRESRTQ